VDIPELDFRGVVFPDKAGELQKANATASVIRELGDNYSKYHAFLAAEVDRLGGPPDRSDYKSFDEYADAWSKIEALVHAEATARRCRGFRRLGRPLDDALDLKVPLAKDNRLVSME
jgi:hypothetical protein